MIGGIVFILGAGAVAFVARAASGGGRPDVTSAAQGRSETTEGRNEGIPITVPETLPPNTSIADAVTTRPTSTPSPTRRPQSYVVSVDCGGSVCALAIRDAPNSSATQVAHIDSGALVSITCSTRGSMIVDGDSGRQSDVWLRFDGAQQYINALYAQGPPVPPC